MRLGEVVRITRGVVTGNRSLFIMTREAARERGIEAFTRPIMSGVRDIPKVGRPVVRDDAAREVIVMASQRDVEGNDRLRAYLRDVKPRLAGANRAPIAVSYVGIPRFVANPDGLVITNALYTATPRQEMSQKEVLELVERLNGAMAQLPRTRHAGRRSPRQMEALEI